MYDTLSNALVAAGLAPHDEPRGLGPDGAFSCAMSGYSGLHHLRRLAAYIGEGIPVPSAGIDDPAADPVLEGYYDLLAPEFEHLLMHSDATGFYVPVKLDEVVFVEEEIDEENVLGGMIGSSVNLLEECLRLAQWLELPTDLDHESDEVWDAMGDPPAEGPKWKVFGKESFHCIRLIRACQASIRTGAAVVFC
ncbi:hypothetical protein [Mitsuaria sp. 7]|uniref:hypothetical protein n=1 Tax=Mitsuaria sp. 7 TaxID=1658665 RepID=UPI0012FA1734|nr:hypothetical protein [Mitsuaria sp. 7]